MLPNDATPQQKSAIARLSTVLHISEPIEEQKMSKGQAGLLIRRLYNLTKSGKKRRSRG